jgi:hypothetical protein
MCAKLLLQFVTKVAFFRGERVKILIYGLIRKYYNYNIWIPPIKIRSIFSKFICLFPSAKY